MYISIVNRSSWKGAFIDNSLVKKKIKKITTVYSRRSVIYPNYVNKIVNIYNGNKFIKVKITSDMVGHKFGEFAATRQVHIFGGKKAQ